ncbi:MAG: sulfatase-like hydrolase/transferase [Candidatus Zixiibacteriota bacterium]
MSIFESKVARILIAWLPSPAYMFIIACGSIGLLGLSGLRFLFLLNYYDRIFDAGWSDAMHGMALGMQFDLVIVLYSLAPLLIVLPWIPSGRKWMGIGVVVYATIVSSLIFLLQLADIRYYNYFDSHLSIFALEYLNSPDEMWHLISTERAFVPFILVWAIATMFSVYLYMRVWRSCRRLGHEASPIATLIFQLIAISASIVGIRGGLTLAPLDWGSAYTSSNHFVNQLPLNGIYTLGRTLTEKNRDPRISVFPENQRYPFVPDQAAIDSTRAMIAQSGDSWLEPQQSLKRVTHHRLSSWGFKPNVVIVVMESWPAKLTGSLGDTRNLTPHFDSLAEKGMLFTRCYAGGIRSSYGLAAILCSFPPLPGRPISNRYSASNPFRSLADILDDRGYSSTFCYGGDPDFDNMRGFFTGHGFDKFLGDTYFGANDEFSKWGIPDHILLPKVASLSDSLTRPYLLTVFTLSNHEPWDLPDSSFQRYSDNSDSSKVFNELVYVDHALGQFMNGMSRRPAHDSTIYLFVSDHCRYEGSRSAMNPVNWHIPLLIYSPALFSNIPMRINTAVGQIDILPSLMEILGGDYEHESWGRNIFDPASQSSAIAFLNINNVIGGLSGDTLYYEVLGGNSGWTRVSTSEHVALPPEGLVPESLELLRRRTHLFMQAAEQKSLPPVATANQQ